MMSVRVFYEGTAYDEEFWCLHPVWKGWLRVRGHRRCSFCAVYEAGVLQSLYTTVR